MSENKVIHAAVADFKRSVEITRDARFQANNRLSQRQQDSAYIISILSLFVIAISLIPNIFRLQPYQNQILLAFSIVISVFVIFTSLIDSSKNFYHQGEILHQCARRIGNIHLELKGIDIDSDPGASYALLKKLQSEYKEILDDCPFNHDRIDFYRAILDKPHLFIEEVNSSFFWLRSVRLSLICFFSSRSWMIMPVTVIIIVSIVIFRDILLQAPLILTRSS